LTKIKEIKKKKKKKKKNTYNKQTLMEHIKHKKKKTNEHNNTKQERIRSRPFTLAMAGKCWEGLEAKPPKGGGMEPKKINGIWTT